MKILALILSSFLLLSSCNTPMTDTQEVNIETTDMIKVNTQEQTNTKQVDESERKGIDEYVEMVQNLETRDQYLSEAAPANYSLSTRMSDGEPFDLSSRTDDTIHKYTEPNLNNDPEALFSGLDSLFYLKETSADGTETWFGPFQGLYQ